MEAASASRAVPWELSQASAEMVKESPLAAQPGADLHPTSFR
jgi:hypothetical protein